MGSSFQTLGAVAEKACLPELSLVFGTISRVVVVDRARYVRVDSLN